MAAPFAWNGETILDDSSSDRTTPTAATLANGDIVIAWHSLDPVESESTLSVRLLGPDGTPKGPEIIIRNTLLESTQEYTTALLSQLPPEISPLESGGFILGWNEFEFTDDPPISISAFTQAFDANGDATGDISPVGEPGSSGLRTVTDAPDGQTLVVWASVDLETQSIDGLFARYLGADGEPAGAVFPIDAASGFDVADRFATTFLADGSLAAAWFDVGAEDDGTFLKVQRLDGDGEAIGAAVEVTTIDDNDDVDGLTVAGLQTGGFVVVWSDNAGLGDDTQQDAVYAQVLNADGSKLGNRILVNTETVDNQTAPSVAVLPTGGFVITWIDGDGSTGSVMKGQSFDSSGAKNGGEFIVGDGGFANALSSPGAIATHTDGRVTIAWPELEVLAATDFEIRLAVQTFDPRDQPVDFFGTQNVDHYYGTAYDDRLSGFHDDDRLFGENGNDIVRGQRGEDVLHGGNGLDRMIGGRDKDKLFGDAGADLFIFRKLAHSTTDKAGRDVIKDFDSSEGDLIDLSAIDARTGGGDSNFKLTGNADFSDKKGELRTIEKTSAVIVKGDVDGDGKADFAIRVKGAGSLTEDDFIL